MIEHSYQIEPRPAHLGGWRCGCWRTTRRCGGVFPAFGLPVALPGDR